MPTPRFPLPFTTRRFGFTLIEIVVATALAALIMAMAINVFMGANKAKALIGSQDLLKEAGQGAFNQLYEDLHRNRHLFDNGPVARYYLNQLDLWPNDAAVTPGFVASDVVFPTIEANGSFYASGANFVQSSVGNALLFASAEPEAIIVQPAGPANQLGIIPSPYNGSNSVRIGAFRLNFYFLARHQLQAGQFVRPGDQYTYELGHWQSKPYLDYTEIYAFLHKIDMADTASKSTDVFVDNKLTALQTTFAGAIDLSADPTTGAPWLYDLTRTGAENNGTSPYTLNLTPAPASELIKVDSLLAATKFDMDGAFGLPMVAFNTQSGGGHLGVKAGNLFIPRYGDPTTGAPYGFEVMIAGPQSNRQVMLHLALAARTMPGHLMVGQEFQQVVETPDY